MRRIMRAFKLHEISGVDRPAQAHARSVIMKRDFSSGERRRDARSGAAESDGSFPIENKTDLHNAMRAVGRSKNPAKTKAHIRARARALGLTSELSDAFKREDNTLLKALGFLKNFGVSKDSLAESLKSIVEDDKADNKVELIEETIKQFSEHVEGEFGKTLPEGLPGDTSESDKMSVAMKKALGLADTATEEDIIKAIAGKDAAIAKANEDAAALAKGASDAELAKAAATMAEMAKSIADLKAERELASFAKKAEEIGVPPAKAEVLMKASHGDAASVAELFEMIKTANAALDQSEIMKELGSANAVEGDEMSLLNAKAAELRKADPSLTPEQAFAKAYIDPANRVVVKAERRKNRPAAA